METWLTLREAYEISNYNPEYIRQLARKKLIKAQKFGFVWQIDRESLLHYIAEQERKKQKP